MPFVLFGLAVAWGVMLAFGGTPLDRGIFMLLYAGDRPGWAEAALLVTRLGDWEVLVLLTAVGAGWLLWKRAWGDVLLLAAVAFGGRLLVIVQKDHVARIRPDLAEHLAPVESLSFPSGHAANSALVLLALALLLPRPGWPRIVAVWLAAWAALAVGASRVMLGVHWPTDVIGGWAFALLWLVAAFAVSGRSLGDGTRGRTGSLTPPKE